MSGHLGWSALVTALANVKGGSTNLMGKKSTARPFTSRGGSFHAWVCAVRRQGRGLWDKGKCHSRGGLCPGGGRCHWARNCLSPSAWKHHLHLAFELLCQSVAPHSHSSLEISEYSWAQEVIWQSENINQKDSLNKLKKKVKRLLKIKVHHSGVVPSNGFSIQ